MRIIETENNGRESVRWRTNELKFTKVVGRMGSSSGPSMNGYRFESYSIGEVAATFERHLGTKVINTTGLEGKFDFEVKLDIYKPETYSGGFKELGLELSDEKRELDVIVVE